MNTFTCDRSVIFKNRQTNNNYSKNSIRSLKRVSFVPVLLTGQCLSYSHIKQHFTMDSHLLPQTPILSRWVQTVRAKAYAFSTLCTQMTACKVNGYVMGMLKFSHPFCCPICFVWIDAKKEATESNWDKILERKNLLEHCQGSLLTSIILKYTKYGGNSIKGIFINQSNEF